MCCADQFLRIAALEAFETLSKTVRVTIKSATLGGYVFLSVFQSALPLSGTILFDRHKLSPGKRG
jgi:hypothetical protein